ncbi:hypothetical protein [Microcoleus sp. N3A4]|uniref:hypothetical protein n=1 Tax=Microcoleus sp. N3A4 TaxID=3055379 RepID=UPI002FD79B4C
MKLKQLAIDFLVSKDAGWLKVRALAELISEICHIISNISVKPGGRCCKVRTRFDKSAAESGIPADRILLRSLELRSTLRQIDHPIQH